MADLKASLKSHAITFPLNAKAAEDIDANFDVLFRAVAAIVARLNQGSAAIEIPVQTSQLLQQNVHVDTRTKTRVLGDLIQAIGPYTGAKFWGYGAALLPLLTGSETGGAKFWGGGLVFPGIFGGASGDDVLWDRLPIGPSGTFLKSTGAQAEWSPIGDLGTITASSQPAAKAYKTSNQTIADGANASDFFGGTQVVFHTTEYDQGGFWSAGSPSRLTVPSGQGGKYVVIGQASWETITSGRRCAWIYKNGRRRGITEIPGDDGGLNLSFCVATTLALVPGDYVELFVRIDNVGSSKQLLGDTSDLSLTQLQLVKVA